MKDYDDDAPMSATAHRILTIVAWMLLALGLLEWFVLGANRPLDPVLVPAVVLPLFVRLLAQ